VNLRGELYLGSWEEVNRNEWRQVRVTAVSGIDDATVGTTDWKGFREQDRVDEIEDVEGAGERCSAVHVPQGLGLVDGLVALSLPRPLLDTK